MCASSGEAADSDPAAQLAELDRADAGGQGGGGGLRMAGYFDRPPQPDRTQQHWQRLPAGDGAGPLLCLW